MTIITIDGKAGTGKSTVAKILAKRLGFTYVDTGAMFRILTYLLIKKGILLSDTDRLGHFLKNFSFEMLEEKGTTRYFAENEDITEVIRSQKITAFVSEVASISSIRKTLLELQRRMGEKGNTVFEGRDMGTVVFPNADLKIFLTATEEVASKRRYLELLSKSKETISQEEVLKKMQERDRLDSQREIAPLKKAQDAYEIDTSDLTIEQVVEKILSLIP